MTIGDSYGSHDQQFQWSSTGLLIMLLCKLGVTILNLSVDKMLSNLKPRFYAKRHVLSIDIYSIKTSINVYSK